MATILSGDVGVQYFDANRQKRLYWIGGTNDEYTLNELYSAMQTLLDESDTIDDGTAFYADTPTEYQIGKIDQGDAEPWYISFDLMEHITGGALRTTGWARVQDSNTGILIVPVTAIGSNIVAADAGNDITHGDGDSGTLLEYIDTGLTNDYCVIRPDSSAIGNSFDSGASGTLTCNTHTASQAGSGTTGEMVWANLYSIGTIDPNVHIYLYQGEIDPDGTRARRFSWNSDSLDWYGNGHIDLAIPLKDITQASWSIIDGGYITALARKSGDLYASFEVSCNTTSGGSNPIPLQTSGDLNQGTGIKKELTGSWSTSFIDGEVIVGTTSGARGIVDLDNSLDDTHLVYFPIATVAKGGELKDFQDSETITGQSSSCTATSSGTPSNFGPADSGWYSGSGVPTASFGDDTFDIDDDGTVEYYGVTIDCNQNRLYEVYEWAKWQTRYGETTNDLDGINGELYLGGTAYFEYTTMNGTISEGESVTQQSSGAIGVIISINTSQKVVLLRSTRGTFVTGQTVDADDDSDDFTGIVAVANFAAKTDSPLGTYAGGTFFGARGVLIEDWHSNDENAFILTDIEGETYERPQAISFVVINLVGGAETSNEHDHVAIFKLESSGGPIDKDEYNVTGTPSAGDATLAVDEAITQDTPGKSTGGTLIIVVDPGLGTAQEYRVRYSSWATSTFTLANTTGSCTTGTDDDTLVDSGASFTTTAKRGDLVYTAKGLSYVKTVDDDNTLQLTKAISGLVATDAYELNCVPVSLDSGDDVYVPIMHRVATGSSESVSVIYVATVYYRVRVRNTRNTTQKIRNYSSDGSTSGTDQTIQVVRNPDNIIS